MTEKLYTIQHTKQTKKNKNKQPKIRFVLNESSGFKGVVVEFRDIQVLEEAKPDGTNCQITYDIIKVPKGKYQDMEDIQKDKFEKVIHDIFVELLQNSMKAFEENEKLQKLNKTVSAS